MANALDSVSKDALNLPVEQRLVLAGILLESAEAAPDAEASAAWDSEIRARIQALDDGRISGVPYAKVLGEANVVFESLP